MKKIKISVGELVAWVHRTGDLNYDTSHYGRNRAAEGRQVHTWLQKKRQNTHPESYQAEVSISHIEVIDNLEIKISGRIDGLRPDEYWMEEIKSLGHDHTDLESHQQQLHWAQLFIYAYLYSHQQQLQEIKLCLSYVQVQGKNLFEEEKLVSYAQLNAFFRKTIKAFSSWALLLTVREQEKQNSATELEFPYPDFRAGQREMSAQVYQAIRHGQPLMVQAATGIGKTLASIFPAVKAIGKGYIDKLVYLSARSTGQQVAREALQLLRDTGLCLVDLTISAKGKVCLEPEAGCDPLLCQYARDYFTKLKEAMPYAMQHYQSFDRVSIDKLAHKFQVCPFELSLDLAHHSDAVICDYNYLFDPTVSLKHFFNGNNNPVILIDEAHNLVDRSREMYSIRLYQESILELKRLLKDIYPVLSRQLAQLSRVITHSCKKLAGDTLEQLQSLPSLPEDLLKELRLLRYKMEAVLARGEELKQQDKFLRLFFDLCHFLNMAVLFDDHFVFNMEAGKKQRWIEIYCLDPARQIQSIAATMQSCIYFSATLTPHDYYAQVFEQKDMHTINIPSPFPIHNQLSLIATHIHTTYPCQTSCFYF